LEGSLKDQQVLNPPLHGINQRAQQLASSALHLHHHLT
jgi:hypothetical protein